MIWRAIPKIYTATDWYLSYETCLRVLSFCNSRSLKQGICVHSPITKMGLQCDPYLSNNLLSVYAKCFGAQVARHLFDEMPHRDVVSWTALLCAYKKVGSHQQALDLFDSMIVFGERPNEFTIATVLQSCCALGKFKAGTRIQALMVKEGFQSNMVLGNILIDLYSKCNLPEEGYKVLISMRGQDTVLWTTMISSFIQAQSWIRALKLYPQMLAAGISPNEFTFVNLLIACTSLGLGQGKVVHGLLITRGIELNLVVKTALVDMYIKCQKMEDALKVSNQTPEKDVLLWTSIISGYAQNLMFSEAVDTFREMGISGVHPNNYTLSGILNACSSVLNLELGQQIHSRVIATGLEEDVSVGNALVDLYMKCSNTIEAALRVFRGISSPNVISWTSLISGFSEHGFENQSFGAFVKMQVSGVQPNSFTLSALLRACGAMESLSQTRMLHGYIIKAEAGSDIIVENALVDLYAKSGRVDYAWRAASMMDCKDAITYTSLATRINETGDHEKALHIFKHMIDEEVEMDSSSLASFLSTSAGLTAKETGKQIHCYSLKSGLCSWISVSNAIVDLYGKCGCMQDARLAFKEIKKPDVVSHNGLIHGLASNGYISDSLSAFEDMRLAGVDPDAVTFLSLLFACSHGGLVDLGFEYFESMRETFDIVPQLDHFVCLVDLFGRAGRLEEAMNVIETMPFRPDAMIYKTLLSACRLHGNIPLGEDMARRGLELDPYDPSLYLLLESMYNDFGLSELGEKTRKLMRERGLRKKPSQSWLEVKNKIHTFAAGDMSHPLINEIHKKLESLIAASKHGGLMYREERDAIYHSEKLAVAFGLLSTPTIAPIHIYKNKCICSDCHQFIMTVTQLVDREIIIKDGNRLHSFKKGTCSCRGY